MPIQQNKEINILLQNCPNFYEFDHFRAKEVVRRLRRTASLLPARYDFRRIGAAITTAPMVEWWFWLNRVNEQRWLLDNRNFVTLLSTDVCETAECLLVSVATKRNLSFSVCLPQRRTARNLPLEARKLSKDLKQGSKFGTQSIEVTIGNNSRDFSK